MEEVVVSSAGMRKAQPSRKEELSRLTRLLVSQETSLQVAFLAAVKAIGSAIELGVITDIVRAGDIGAALDKLDEHAPGLFQKHFVTQRTKLVQNAGTAQAKAIVENTPLVQVRFNVVNQRAVDAMRENELRLVSSFTETQRETTHRALTRGIEEGRNPRHVARDFRNSIGLTPTQEQAVDNYRRGLIEQSPDVFNRRLRDRRFDRSLRTAFRSGKALESERIEMLTERYRKRFIKYRAEVIGRTEALRSANEGTQEMWEQAVEEGQIDRRLIRRYWHPAKDDRVRNSHALIPRMNAKGRGINEPFLTVLGPLLQPGDPAGVPANVIQCRCIVTTEILTEQEADKLEASGEAVT